MSGPAAARSAVDQAAVVAAALILLAGGLVGETQLVVGDFVVTGSLPAKGPIVGVALIVYGASIVLGASLLLGRGWLPAVNLAIVFAILYLIAAAKPLMLALGIAHAVAAALLLWQRRSFGIRFGELDST